MTAENALTPAEQAILDRVGRVEAEPAVLAWFLGPEADAAVQEVFTQGMSPDGMMRMPAAVAIAYHRWFHYIASEGVDARELGDALLCFAAIREQTLDPVPPALLPLLDVLTGRPGDGVVEPSEAFEAGSGLVMLYDLRRDPVMLVAAERLLRHAIAALPPGSAEQGTCLSTLGLARLFAFQEGAGREAAAEAVEHSRAAVAAAPGEPAEQARRHGNLGFVLRHWADATEDPAAMRESLSELRLAVRMGTAEDTDHIERCAGLGSALYRAAAMFGDPSMLPEAVELLRGAVVTTTPPRATHLAELGIALVMDALANDRPEAYDEGVESCRLAAEHAPNPIERATYLSNLGLVLKGSWIRGSDIRLLDDAEAASRAAAAGMPAGHPMRVKVDFVLSGVLRSRHGATGRLADLDEAIALARGVFDATPAQDRGLRVARGRELADLLRLRARAVDTPEAVDEPIALLRELARTVPEPSADRSDVLFVLARCLQQAPESRDEALDRFRECLTLPFPSRTSEAEIRFALGSALAERAGPGDQDLWRQAVEQMRQGIALLPPSDSRHAEYLSDFTAISSQRATATGDLDLYQEAVRLGREAVARVPAGNTSEAAMCRSNLGAALATLAQRAGDVEMLAEAVESHRAAVALSPPGDHHRVHRMGNLGDALQRLAEIRSDPSLLEEAVAVLRESVASEPGTPSRAGCLTKLGHALRSLYRFTGDQAALDEAVEWHRAAIAASPGPPPAVALVGLANSLADQYGHTHEGRLRDESVELLRTARARVPESSEDMSAISVSLGHVEWKRALDAGDPVLMDEAVVTLREALAAVPAGHSGRALALTNLGVALMERAQISGDSTWLAESVAVLRTAVAESPPTSFDRVGHLNNLAASLLARYRIAGDAVAGEEAATLLREAEALTSSERSGADLTVLNLGLLLHSRASSSGDPQGMAEARRVLEEAVAKLAEGSDWRGVALNNLASVCLEHSLIVDGEPAVRQALHRAVSAAREALTCMPDGSPNEASTLLVLGTAQVLRAEQGEPVDLVETARLSRQAAENPTAPLVSRLLAARVWGNAAARAGRDADALAGLAYAVGLLPRIAPRSLSRADQEDRLQSGPGLASDAAAFALRVGDPGRALTLLEQGRAVLLAQGIDNRGQLSQVRAVAPALADEFELIRDQLSVVPQTRPALWTDATPGQPADGGLTTDARHTLARRWDELVAEIRALPGLSGFLRAPDLPDLISAAAEGPVVVVNVSEYRSDAIVVTADGRLEVVPLPGLTPATVLTQAAIFLEAIEWAYGSQGVQNAVSAMGLLTEILRWLWDSVAGPVLDRLGLRTVPLDDEPWTRLWWCPTGWLSFLPLHAAGRDGPDSGKWVVDRVIPSYTPTVRALVRARRQLALVDRVDPRPLVVAIPDTPGAEPLPGVADEAAAVLEIFPAGRQLLGSEATLSAVREALSGHSWVHFGCHGVTDTRTPSASGLVLHDGRLTTLDVAAERPDRPQLAVLSACSTSQGGLDLPDEAVQLASSFQLAGYPHVIGTLWPVADELSTHVIQQFYAALAHDIAQRRPIAPATALHGPTRALRDRYAKAPHLWAAYVHTGP
ncbi:CHAT domain-containing protein [Kutzneria sp. NPDC052558]|uniref:CHAT domain-containing protein n=1 Tax=Kutzneria sp. NPDC052558 TaxID=3364121 RepID=UPI0037C93A8A